MVTKLIVALLFLLPRVCVAQNVAQITKPIDGATIFRDHCAACHGADGRGHGPAASALKHSVPDLTLITQKNDGKFPYRGVRNAIEGIEPLTRTHASREMPVWGPIFHEVEADQDWGEVRLEAITRHIESIQQK